MTGNLRIKNINRVHTGRGNMSIFWLSEQYTWTAWIFFSSFRWTTQIQCEYEHPCESKVQTNVAVNNVTNLLVIVFWRNLEFPQNWLFGKWTNSSQMKNFTLDLDNNLDNLQLFPLFCNLCNIRARRREPSNENQKIWWQEKTCVNSSQLVTEMILWFHLSWFHTHSHYGKMSLLVLPHVRCCDVCEAKADDACWLVADT